MAPSDPPSAAEHTINGVQGQAAPAQSFAKPKLIFRDDDGVVIVKVAPGLPPRPPGTDARLAAANAKRRRHTPRPTQGFDSDEASHPSWAAKRREAQRLRCGPRGTRCIFDPDGTRVAAERSLPFRYKGRRERALQAGAVPQRHGARNAGFRGAVGIRAAKRSPAKSAPRPDTQQDRRGGARSNSVTSNRPMFMAPSLAGAGQGRPPRGESRAHLRALQPSGVQKGAPAALPAQISAPHARSRGSSMAAGRQGRQAGPRSHPVAQRSRSAPPSQVVLAGKTAGTAATQGQESVPGGRGGAKSQAEHPSWAAAKAKRAADAAQLKQAMRAPVAQKITFE